MNTFNPEYVTAFSYNIPLGNNELLVQIFNRTDVKKEEETSN